MEDCEMRTNDETIIWCDNKSTIAIAKNPLHHGRTKHIDIKFHFIRSLIDNGTIAVKHCTTNEQHADLLTKALTVKKHDMLKR